MYLNQVYFGHGAYGVEAAARTYFGKSVSELNVREAALLGRAAASALDLLAVRAPRGGQTAARRRPPPHGGVRRPQGREAKRLARAELGLIPPERRRTTGQYFLEYVQQTLEAKYGADMVFKGGSTSTRPQPHDAAGRRAGLRDGLKALEAAPARPQGRRPPRRRR